MILTIASPPKREGRGEAIWSCDAVKHLDEREPMSDRSFHRATQATNPLVAFDPAEILIDLEVGNQVARTR